MNQEKTPFEQAIDLIQTKFETVVIGKRTWGINLKELWAKDGEWVIDLDTTRRKINKLINESDIGIDPNDFNKLFTTWDNNPDTPNYDTVRFDPRVSPEQAKERNMLNLWRDPTVTPEPGDYSTIEEFLRNVICSGEDFKYDYLVNYLAHAWQKPEEKPKIMIALNSDTHGAGKGTLLRLIETLWGDTTAYGSVGQIKGFNSSLFARSLWAIFDEADFSSASVALEMKKLITEPKVSLNQKFVDIKNINSFHRFVATTNNDSVGKLEVGERRHFVLTVSGHRAKDSAYWNKVYESIKKTEIRAFAHHLSTRDISQFNPGADRPKTEEHTDQVLGSLNGLNLWWSECLFAGRITFPCGSGHEDSVYFVGEEPIDGAWGTVINKPDLRASVIEFFKGKKNHDSDSTRAITMFLTKKCPSATDSRTKTHRIFKLPTVHQARKDFEVALGIEIDWLDGDTKHHRNDEKTAAEPVTQGPKVSPMSKVVPIKG